jgi:hypothetical protein
MIKIFEYYYNISKTTIEEKENIVVTFPLNNLRFFIEDYIIKTIYEIPIIVSNKAKLIPLNTKNKEVICSINKIKELGLV